MREAEVVPALDAWLAEVFDPRRLDETLESLLAIQEPTAADEARLASAHRALTECDAKLERYRAALGAGTDPTPVGRWIREVTDLRQQAEREIRASRQAHRGPSNDELVLLARKAGDLVRAIRRADPQIKAGLHASLGLDVIYKPDGKRLLVEADLSVCQDRVGGPELPKSHPEWRLRPWPIDRRWTAMRFVEGGPTGHRDQRFSRR